MNATITYPLNLFLIIIGSFLWIRLTLFLLLRQSRQANSNNYLGILIFVIGIPLMVGVLERFELLVYVPHIIGIQLLGHFLIGPLTFFYVKACTQKGFEFRPIMCLHFIPAVLELVVSFPFLLESAEFKLQTYKDFLQYGKLYTAAYLGPLKAIHGIFYFALSVRIIYRYRHHVGNASSIMDKSFHRWLLLFVFMVAFPIFMLIYIGFGEYNPSVRFMALIIGYVLFFMSIDIAILLKPQLFQHFPFQAAMPDSSEVKKQKYESSNLSEPQKETYLRKIKTHLDEHKAFRAPELSLGELSEELKIPSHYLSQVINEKLGTNFLDMINQYRVEDTKENLSDQSKNHFTIMAIAYDSGFNSKSTFYAAFKKHTGMTPSQYRKQLLVEA